MNDQLLMTDDGMRRQLATPGHCFLVILREGSCYLPGPGDPGSSGEDPLNGHVRYWFRLMQEGIVAFFGPVTDNSGTKWIAIFPTDDRQLVVDSVGEDPDVRSKRLSYEIHPVAGVGTKF